MFCPKLLTDLVVVAFPRMLTSILQYLTDLKLLNPLTVNQVTIIH